MPNPSRTLRGRRRHGCLVLDVARRRQDAGRGREDPRRA